MKKEERIANYSVALIIGIWLALALYMKFYDLGAIGYNFLECLGMAFIVLILTIAIIAFVVFFFLAIHTVIIDFFKAIK